MTVSKAVLEALAYVEAAYPAWRPSEETAVVWQDILGQMDPNALRASVRAYVASGAEYAPNPGQVLQLSLEGEPEPLEAWGEVQLAVRTRNKEPEWSHPHIGRAVRAIGGFGVLGRELGEATRTSFRARFVDCMKNLPQVDAHTDAYQLAKAATEEAPLEHVPTNFLKPAEVRESDVPF